MFTLIVLLLLSVHIVIAGEIDDQSPSDIYYEMNSKFDDLSENTTEDQRNEQIKLTGDKYKLTYQESKELYQKGNVLELGDE